MEEGKVSVEICQLRHKEIDSRFDRLEKMIKEGFEKLDRYLNGNGKPGLFQRVDKLEFNVEKILAHLAEDEQEKKETRKETIGWFQFLVGPILRVIYPVIFAFIGILIAQHLPK